MAEAKPNEEDAPKPLLLSKDEQRVLDLWKEIKTLDIEIARQEALIATPTNGNGASLQHIHPENEAYSDSDDEMTDASTTFADQVSHSQNPSIIQQQ